MYQPDILAAAYAVAMGGASSAQEQGAAVTVPSAPPASRRQSQDGP